MKKLVLLFLLCLSQFYCFSLHFTLNEEALSIYEEVFKFRTVTAKELAKDAKDQENIAFDFLALTAEFLELTNAPNDEKIESYTKKEELLFERLGKLKNTEPFKKYCQAELHFRAAIFKLYKGDYLSGGIAIRKSYKLLEENKKKHPNFIINNKTYSLIKIIVGSIPKKYKFIESLSGIDGNVESGIKMLAGVSYKKLDAQYKWIQKESRLLYSICLFSLKNNKELSFRIIKRECMDYRTNLFSNYIYAIHASMQGENDLVLGIINKKPKINEVEIEYLDFLYGSAKLRKLEYTASINKLKLYISNTASKSNKYDAYKLVYWAYLLKGEKAKAKVYSDLAKKENPDKFDEDFSFMPGYFDKKMLQVTLTYDGGYYQKALSLLDKIDVTDLKEKDLKVEYYYRYGRVFEELKRYDEALKYYAKTREEGKNSKRYFTRKSAVQTALVYKELSNTTKAKEFLDKAIDGFEASEEYERAIIQQAKILKKSL